MGRFSIEDKKTTNYAVAKSIKIVQPEHHTSINEFIPKPEQKKIGFWLDKSIYEALKIYIKSTHQTYESFFVAMLEQNEEFQKFQNEILPVIKKLNIK